MQDLLWRVCFRRQVWPQSVTGDTTYGTTANIVAIEDAGMRAYVPLPAEAAHPTLRPFRASPTRRRPTSTAVPSTSRCRAGGPSPAKTWSSIAPIRRVCNACPVKADCTTSDQGRMCSAPSLREYLERVRGLSRHRAVPQSAAQAPGLGRAAVRRGQAVARVGPLAPAGPDECQHPGLAHRRRAESEAPAGRARLGPPPRPLRQPPRPAWPTHGDAGGPWLRPSPVTSPTAGVFRAAGSRAKRRGHEAFFNTLGYRLFASRKVQMPLSLRTGGVPTKWVAVGVRVPRWGEGPSCHSRIARANLTVVVPAGITTWMTPSGSVSRVISVPSVAMDLTAYDPRRRIRTFRAAAVASRLSVRPSSDSCTCTVLPSWKVKRLSPSFAGGIEA